MAFVRNRAASRKRSPRRATSRRLPIMAGGRRSRRLSAVVGLFLLLITGIVGYNARATGQERDQSLVVNVASRQRALAERYMKDVVLKVEGVPADPTDDANILRHTADALIHGGTVLAVQGADQTIRIPPVSTDPRVLAKLNQEWKLIGQLILTGRTVIETGARSPAYQNQLQRLRVLGAQVSTISNDAVGEMTLDAEASLSRVVRVGVVLGALGALAALAMGLLLRREGEEQAAQFRALVHNSSDLITVLDTDAVMRYESPAGERVFGHPASDLIGAPLPDAIHPEDAPAVEAALRLLAGEPGATRRLDYRRRAVDGEWRHMETVATNLLDEPMVRGLVLNSRDVTGRKQTEQELHSLQVERAKLLDRTVQATEQERKRLALELHDGPVQHLAALTLKLESVGLVLRRPGRTDPIEMVEQVQVRLSSEVNGLRRIMSDLRPPALDERGLEAALMDHLNAVQTESGLECTVESNLDHRLDSTHETVLYRVAQEALTNAIKHARADHAWVSLRSVKDLVELEVRDDGVGFDPSQVADLAREGHFGLIGMRERVEMAGGRWEVASAPGFGTVVRALFPHAANGNGQGDSAVDRSRQPPVKPIG
jgi:PAS domain S-box-containing protein